MLAAIAGLCRRRPRRVVRYLILPQNPSRFQPAPYTLMGVIEAAAFQRFSAYKTREATIARIERLSTAFDRSDDSGLLGIGNAWSRLHYGGEFRLVRSSRSQTAVSLIFIQTKDGNTGGPNPGALGGGATDQHLIYEGLSRVAADAVLSGAGSVHRHAFFSVWHPELIALRASLSLARHPAQIVVSKRGRLDVNALLFNVPEVRVSTSQPRHSKAVNLALRGIAGRAHHSSRPLPANSGTRADHESSLTTA